MCVRATEAGENALLLSVMEYTKGYQKLTSDKTCKQQVEYNTIRSPNLNSEYRTIGWNYKGNYDYE